MIGVVLALLAAARAAPDDDALWVRVRDAEEAERARAAGLGFGEGQDGEWLRLLGTPAQADAAGLAWRREAAAVDGYAPTPEDVAERLEAVAATGAADLVQLGESRWGEPILALRFGDGPRALRVLGAHHGDEASSAVVALAVAEALAERGVPEGTEVWVVPAVNPDGLRAGSRYNADGVDLNRNYGWAWIASEYRAGDAPFSEPETRAIRALARARDFAGGLSLHSGATNFGWVWNFTADERPPEEALFVDLGEAYAAECAAPGFWITNGADWYVTHGDTTDWTYGAWGAHDFTVELTVDKSPPEDQVDAYVAWHLDAVLAWLERAPDRTAQVRDAVTGEPLPARVVGGGLAEAWTGPDGRWARWLLDPEANLAVSAPGYAEAELADVVDLVPEGLLATLPSPRLLSRGAGSQAVTVEGAGPGDLRLVQPGESDVVVPADAPGAWTVDPAALAPGAWTLVLDEGTIPRGLFVGEVDDRVRIAEVAVEDGILRLCGEGFAVGAEAWALGGTTRAPAPLTPVGEAGADALAFVLPAGTQDALVWTNGAWLSVVDVPGAPQVDTGAPDEDLPPGADVPVVVDEGLHVAGACAAAPGAPVGALGAVAAAAALAARRRRPTGGRGACGLPSARG